MTELHQLSFRWPHTDAQDVIVTGSFDGWSHSAHLTKTSTGFEGAALVPWRSKITYKYIVDGRWTTTDDQPTEYDSIGNLNNVYMSPTQPPPLPEEPKQEQTGVVNGMVESVRDTVSGLAQTAAAMVDAIAPSVESPRPEKDDEATPRPTSSSLPATVHSDATPVQPPAELEEPTPAPAELPAFGSEPVTPGVVLPSSEVESPHLGPEVPMHILPLSPIPPAPTIVEGSTTDTAEDNGEDGPSTHTPDGGQHVGGETREQAIVGETAPKEEKRTATNGTTTEPQSATSGAPEAAKTATNGTSAASHTNGTGTANGTPSSPAATAGTPSPPHSPTATAKEKRMRFPSLSTRRSRRSSSSTTSTSVTEFGEGDAKARDRPETHASRVAGDSIRKKRSSLLGKIKGLFESPSHHGKAVSNGA